MTPAERRMFKNALRSAISKRARGLPLTADEDAALGRLVSLKDRDPHSAKLTAAWATGVPAFAVLAHFERCGARTLQTRLAVAIDRCLGA
jgi:hypothetical protein